jgi:cytoskeletal protein RodZ
MEYSLSIGYVLLVLALRLALLRFSMRGGREEKLKNSGITILVLGLVAEVVVGILKWINVLSSQEITVLLNTGLAIVLVGGVVAIQGQIQQKPKGLNVLKWLILVIALLGLAAIITYIAVH